MKKKLAKLIAGAAAAALLLTGCGTAAPASDSASTAEAAVEAASEEVAQEAASEAPAEEGTETAASEAAEITDDTTARVIALKGPTAMGMISMMDAADEGTLEGLNATFELKDAPDEVAPLLIKGEADIAAVPANLASVIYNKTKGGVSVIAVNTLGVLYIVDNGNPVSTVADLKGKTIYASGKGASPEYALDFILTGNGLDPEKDVTIEWKSEHAECLQALLKNPDSVAMLPQPFVTVAQSKADTVKVDLDLTEEWNKLGTGSEMITGVAVVRNAFAAEHPEVVAQFLADYEASVDWVNNNTDAAGDLIGKYGIIDAAVAKKAIPACNIVFESGDEMKKDLSGYLKVLFDAAPESVGGALPGDDFYYNAQ